MKECKIKYYDYPNKEQSIYDIVDECINKEIYGILKVNNLEIAIDPYENKINGNKQTDIIVKRIAKMIKYKHYVLLAKAILNNDFKTESLINKIYKDYDEYFPVKRMKKNDVVNCSFFEGDKESTIAMLYVEAKHNNKYFYQVVDGVELVTGPYIDFKEVMENYNNVKKLEELKKTIDYDKNKITK